MNHFIDALGVCAACLTTAANVPQVIKSARTGATDDLSLKMLVALALGFIAWLAYGMLREDLIIAAANGISLVLIGVLLSFKLRSRNADNHRHS